MNWRRTSDTLIGADDWPRASRFCLVECCPQMRFRAKTVEVSPSGTVDFGWGSPTLGYPSIGAVRGWRTSASYFQRKQFFDFVGGFRPFMIRLERRIVTTNPTTFATTTTFDVIEVEFLTAAETEVSWDAAVNQDITVNRQQLYLPQ